MSRCEYGFHGLNLLQLQLQFQKKLNNGLVLLKFPLDCLASFSKSSQFNLFRAKVKFKTFVAIKMSVSLSIIHVSLTSVAGFQCHAIQNRSK